MGAQTVDREAAWGFVAEKEALVIYPSILPCTVALEFDPDVPEGALLRARHCYDDLAPRIEDATGARTGARSLSVLCRHARPPMAA